MKIHTHYPPEGTHVASQMMTSPGLRQVLKKRVRKAERATRELILASRALRDFELQNNDFLTPRSLPALALALSDFENPEEGAECTKRWPPLPAEYDALADHFAEIGKLLNVWEKQGAESLKLSYLRGRLQLMHNILSAGDSLLELFNEMGDLFFTFVTLAKLPRPYRWLFWTNVAILAMNLACRVAIALHYAPHVMDGREILDSTKMGKHGSGAFEPDMRVKFVMAALLFLVEPNAGQELLQGTLRKKEQTATGASFKVHTTNSAAMTARRDLLAASSRISTALTMVVLEDVPELVIEIIFVGIVGELPRDFFFWFSIVGTLVHLCRQLVELQYESQQKEGLRKNAENIDVSFPEGKEGEGGKNVVNWAETSNNGSVCRVLLLRRCKMVNDEVAKHIANLCPNLQELRFTNIEKISDEGVKAVAEKCRDLRIFALRGTSVGDEGVHTVARELCLLQELTLRDCKKVTNASVFEVANQCKELRRLVIQGTNMTPENQKQIKQMLEERGVVVDTD